MPMRGYKIVKRCECASVSRMPVVIREKFGKGKPTWYVSTSKFGQWASRGMKAYSTRKAATRAFNKKCKCRRK